MTRIARLPAVLIMLLLAIQVPAAIVIGPPWSLVFQVLSLLLAFAWLLAIRDRKLLTGQASDDDAESSEVVRCMANRAWGRSWVGGHLHEVDGSLCFRPNWFERLLRRRPVELPGSRIRDAGSIPCMPSPFGGVAFCLEVTLTDGEVEVFRVWDPDEQARRVRRMARRTGLAEGPEAPPTP